MTALFIFHSSQFCRNSLSARMIRSGLQAALRRKRSRPAWVLLRAANWLYRRQLPHLAESAPQHLFDLVVVQFLQLFDEGGNLEVGSLLGRLDGKLAIPFRLPHL